MPGASLWIVPSNDTCFYQTLQTLISTTIPPHFPKTKTHPFIPHMTITSNISQSLYTTSSPNPQHWLDSLNLPEFDSAHPISITLETLEAGDAFVKKLTLKAAKSRQLLRLASACRAAAVEGGNVQKADTWATNDYLPHLSLMYADLPKSHVDEHIIDIDDECRKAARSIKPLDRASVARGGRLVLVDTSKPIDQWLPIAETFLPHLTWLWPWSSSSTSEDSSTP